jgi:hypothetical protein
MLMKFYLENSIKLILNGCGRNGLLGTGEDVRIWLKNERFFAAKY